MICNTRVEHATIAHIIVGNAHEAGAVRQPGVTDLAGLYGDPDQTDTPTCNAANGGCDQGGEWKRANGTKTPRPGGRHTMTSCLQAGPLMGLRQRAGECAVAQWAMARICNTRLEHDTSAHSTVAKAHGVADLAGIPHDLVQLDNSACNAANGGCKQGGDWWRATSTKTPRPGGRPARTPSYGATGKQCTRGCWAGPTNDGHLLENAPHTLGDGETTSKVVADSGAGGRTLHLLMSTARVTVPEDIAVGHRAGHTDRAPWTPCAVALRMVVPGVAGPTVVGSSPPNTTGGLAFSESAPGELFADTRVTIGAHGTRHDARARIATAALWCRFGRTWGDTCVVISLSGAQKLLETMQSITAGCPAPFEQHAVIALSRALGEYCESLGRTLLHGDQGKERSGHDDGNNGGVHLLMSTARDTVFEGTVERHRGGHTDHAQLASCAVMRRMAFRGVADPTAEGSSPSHGTGGLAFSGPAPGELIAEAHLPSAAHGTRQYARARIATAALGAPAPLEQHVVLALSCALEEHVENPGLTMLNGGSSGMEPYIATVGGLLGSCIGASPTQVPSATGHSLAFEGGPLGRHIGVGPTQVPSGDDGDSGRASHLVADGGFLRRHRDAGLTQVPFAPAGLWVAVGRPLGEQGARLLSAARAAAWRLPLLRLVDLLGSTGVQARRRSLPVAETCVEAVG